MHTKLDKRQEDTTIVTKATRKKIRSTLACTSSFLTFFTIIHSRGQRYVVPLITLYRNNISPVVYQTIIANNT